MTTLVSNMVYRQNMPCTPGGFIKFLIVCVSFIGVCSSVGAEIRTAVLDEQSGQLSVVDGFQEDFVAWANFTDHITTTG